MASHPAGTLIPFYPPSMGIAEHLFACSLEFIFVPADRQEYAPVGGEIAALADKAQSVSGPGLNRNYLRYQLGIDIPVP